MPGQKKIQATELETPLGPFKSAWHATGHPQADAMVAKAALVSALMDAIEQRGLTQTAAAGLLGIPRPNLSRLFSGEFQSVTFDKLFTLLNGLGIGVRVLFGPLEAGVSVETAA
jgi:predicted XRE-type DNA-binding protein